MKPCLIYLTCADKKEAEKISDALLDKKLAACVKQIPISSSYLWKNKKESADEVLLLIETAEEFFEHIESVVKKLHSYETVVLFAVPLIKVSKETEKWIQSELVKPN